MTTYARAPMRARVLLASLLASFVALAPCGPALAHAQLRSAQPAVGGTVHEGVQDVRLSYSEAVEPRFCRVAVSGPDGKPVEAAKPAVDPADPRILILHLARPLTPGTYKVDWHATSTDTHKTQGSYRFTVAP